MDHYERLIKTAVAKALRNKRNREERRRIKKATKVVLHKEQSLTVKLKGE